MDFARTCNLFSSFVSSLALTLFFYTIWNTFNSVFVAFLSVLALGLSELFFKQALIAEVYSLNSLFFIIILFCLLIFLNKRDCRWIFLAYFFAGLGLGNHHTILGIIFSSFILLFKYLKNWQIFIISFLFFILGITVYIYLPLRSLVNPCIDWGNPETFKNFIEVITRKQFGFGEGDFSIDKMLSQSIYYIDYLHKQFYMPVIILSIYGFIVALKKNRFFSIFTLVTFLINGILTFYVLNPEVNEFFLVTNFITPSLIMLSLFLSYALTSIKEKRFSLYLTICLILLLTISIKFYKQHEEISQKNNLFTYQFAKDTFENLPDKSIIIGEADYSTFPLMYMQNFYYKNKDITILDVDFFMLPWYQKQNIAKLPFLKELIPNIMTHASAKSIDRKIDFSTIELFKLEQSYKLSDNILEKLKRPVFYTYEMYEIAKIYDHPIQKHLYPYGTVYSFKNIPEKRALLTTNIYLNKFYLPEEETFFLRPYIQALNETAKNAYLKNELELTERYLRAIYEIDKTPNNALNYAIILATNNNIDEAKVLAQYLQNSILSFDPRLQLLQGIIAVKLKNYSIAYDFLKRAEQNQETKCESQLFLLELFSKTKKQGEAKLYFEKITKECPFHIKNRAFSLLSN